jgi:hypothetical protein
LFFKLKIVIFFSIRVIFEKNKEHETMT